MRLVDDALGARLSGLHQLMHGDLVLGILPRLLREDCGLFLRLLEQALALLQQALGLIGRGRRGHAQAVNEVEQLLAINGPTRSKPAAPTGNHRGFNLVDQFQEVDGELLPNTSPRSTVAQTPGVSPISAVAAKLSFQPKESPSYPRFAAGISLCSARQPGVI